MGGTNQAFSGCQSKPFQKFEEMVKFVRILTAEVSHLQRVYPNEARFLHVLKETSEPLCGNIYQALNWGNASFSFLSLELPNRQENITVNEGPGTSASGRDFLVFMRTNQKQPFLRASSHKPLVPRVRPRLDAVPARF